MVVLKPNAEERSAGHWSPENLKLAVDAIRRDGFVVLEDVVDPEHIRILREKELEDIDILLNRKDRPFNWNTGNLQQDPPPFEPYLFRDILVNDFAIDVTHAVLGDGVKNAFYSGNTALPSEERQPVHADIGNLWQNMEHPHPAFALVVNVPLVDVSAENGSTEIWPGTQHNTSCAIQDGFIEISPEVLAARRQEAPPLQPTIKAGSILIRDIRLWHAGMPNRTPNPRPMVAMIHYVSWFPTDKLKFPVSATGFFDHPLLRTEAHFVEGPIDYVGAPQAYAFEEAK
jgi:uncharacterized protein YfkK (UPF0435 family)